MTTPFPFVSGATLTAQQLNDIQNLPISDKTASYVLAVEDAYKRTIMNSGSATTITVNNSIFTAGDIIQIANKGAGVCTVTAGAGVTVNTSSSLALAQHGGGYLLCLSASTFTFFSLGGLPVINFDYLIVGGGGGGGVGWNGGAGGGGAGGYVSGSQYFASGDSFTVTVGAGGAAYSDGNNSVFVKTIAVAGGKGGSTGAAAGSVGSVGGSGGGGSAGSGAGAIAGGAGTTNQGTAGGASASNGGDKWGGGGGGGASVGGAASSGSGATGGDGGSGTASSITGSSVTRGGGGGGVGVTTQGVGGTGGGGSAGATTGTAGTANTGGGGGGGGVSSGAGGSGVVILRYSDTKPDLTSIGGGLTYTRTTPTGYKVYTFTAGTGTVTV